MAALRLSIFTALFLCFAPALRAYKASSARSSHLTSSGLYSRTHHTMTRRVESRHHQMSEEAQDSDEEDAKVPVDRPKELEADKGDVSRAFFESLIWGPHARPAAYGPMLVAFLIFLAVTRVLLQHGILPFFTVLIYLVSLCMVQVLFKMALDNGYSYPYFLTCCHLVLTGLVACCFDPPQSLSEMAWLFPVAFASGISLALNNTSLTHAGVGFVAMLSSCTPATTCLLEVIMRRRKSNMMDALSVAGACMGGILCTKGERNFSSMAVLLSLGAAFFRSLRCIWQHDLLQEVTNGSARFSPCRITAWSALMFAVVLFPFAMGREGTPCVLELAGASRKAHIGIVGSTISAMIMNIAQPMALRHIGPVLQHAMGNLQLAAVIFLASSWLDERITALQWIGTVMVVCGVMMISGPAPKKNEEVIKKAEKERRMGNNPFSAHASLAAAAEATRN